MPRPLLLVPVLLACDPTSTTPSDTGPSTPTTDPWVGLGPLTLTADGDTIEETVYASGGWEVGADQPPLIVVVLGEGKSTDTMSDGYAFTNMTIKFETDPKGTGDDWLEGRDVSVDAGVGVLMTGDASNRLIGEGGASLCATTMTHREELPPNILTPDTRIHRYGVHVDCTSIPWEVLGKSPAEGAWASMVVDFDTYIGVIE